MSSFQLLNIDDIIIGEDRGREGVGDPKKFEELVQSIAANNRAPWHPIIVHSDMKLVAGYRRLMACKQLGCTTIPAHIYENLSPLRQKEIELEENIVRHDLSWDERTKLWSQIHAVKQEIHGATHAHGGRPTTEMVEARESRESDGGEAAAPPVGGWGISDTANLVGRHKAEVSRALKLARIMEIMPNLAKIANNEMEAHKIVDEVIEELERELAVRNIIQLDQNILLGDCIEVLRTLETASVDCIVTDPPYGTNLQNIGSAIKGHRSGAHFDDSAGTMRETLKAALTEMRRVLKPQGHFYMFFSITFLNEVQQLCVSAGFDTDDMPLIWVKDASRWGTGDWRFHFPKEYEPIIFASGHVDGGERRTLNFTHGNTFHYDKLEEARWPAQKPLALLSDLIKLSTREGEVVLDPFAGSGSTALAALQLNRRYIAIEKNEQMYKVILERVHIAGEQYAAKERAELDAKSQIEINKYLEENEATLEDDEVVEDDI